MPFIYIHYNTKNDKMYVGQTRGTVENRMGDHYSRADAIKEGKIKGCYYPNALNKYPPKDWLLVSLEYPEDMLNEMETRFNQEYDTNDPRYGYNLTTVNV